MILTSNEGAPAVQDSSTGESPARTTVPAERIYWAVLPVTIGSQPETAWAIAFEQYVPFPHELLHCAFTVLPDGRLLAAGLPHAEMAQFYEDPELSGNWTLTPSPLPEALAQVGVPATAICELNFLHGSYEPRPRRRLRQWCSGSAIGVLCLMAVVGLLGGEWSARQDRQRVAEIHAEQNRLAEQPLVGEPATGTNLPVQARLLMAYRSRSQATSGVALEDVFALSERILSTLPAGISVIEIQANQQRLMIRGTFSTQGDEEALVAAVGKLETRTGHWQPEPADYSRQVGATSTWRLSWRRAEGETP